MKQYKCDWCGRTSSSDEWDEFTRRMWQSVRLEQRIPQKTIDGFSMETCDDGDTVYCPLCGAGDERSEIEEVE